VFDKSNASYKTRVNSGGHTAKKSINLEAIGSENNSSVKSGALSNVSSK
jgi:hypothetical protein